MQKLRTYLTNNRQLLFIILFSIVIFSPALNNFFSGDDWFHLKVVQISSVGEFLNFFNPVANPQSIAFYRPISSQLFFYVFNTLFGLWSFPYYLFLFAVFVANIILFYKILLNWKFSKTTALIAVFIFSISHTHFAQLNFLSAGQEMMMSVFFLAGILINQSKKQTLSTYIKVAICFVLALLSKDNAIVFPVVIFILDWLADKKIHWLKMSILSLITALYVLIRFFIFDTSMIEIDTYELNFSPRLFINTLYFYVLWAVGGAELLQDYLSSPIKLIDRYFTDFQLEGRLLILFLFASFASLGILCLTHIKKFSVKYMAPLVLFIITLAPVLFLPHHKFTIQMMLPMMCFSIFIAWLCEKKSKVLVGAILILLVALNLTSIYMTSRTHYSVQRSNISKKVYNYFSAHYPTYPSNKYLLFKNSHTPGSDIVTWGSSRQISYALWGSNFAKVFFNDPTIEVYYEDIEYEPPKDKEPIELDSGQFL